MPEHITTIKDFSSHPSNKGSMWPIPRGESEDDYIVTVIAPALSTILDEVNFDTLMLACGDDGYYENVRHFTTPHRFLILKHTAPEEVIKKVDDMIADLREYTPCLDEDEYALRQDDAIMERWGDEPSWNRIQTCKEVGVSIFQARRPRPGEKVLEHMREIYV